MTHHRQSITTVHFKVIREERPDRRRQAFWDRIKADRTAVIASIRRN